MDASFYLIMHFWYLLMLVYIDLSLFKNENHILRGLVNSWLTIKTLTASRGEKGFCCHLQSEPTASDPPDLGNGSVLKAASGMVKETVSFSHRLRSPIVKNNDTSIKLVSCPLNCTNFTWYSWYKWGNPVWLGLTSIRAWRTEGTLVPQRQPCPTFLPLAKRVGFSECQCSRPGWFVDLLD